MSMQLNEINERERERRRVNSTQRDPAHPSVDHFSLDINYKKQKKKRRRNTLPAAGNAKFANYVKLKIAIKTFICQGGPEQQHGFCRRLKNFKIARKTLYCLCGKIINERKQQKQQGEQHKGEGVNCNIRRRIL